MLKMPSNYDAQLVTAQRMKPDGSMGVYVGDYEMTPQDLQNLEQWRQDGIAAKQAQSGGNSIATLMNNTNAAAGRVPQEPTMYAGGNPNFDMSPNVSGPSTLAGLKQMQGQPYSSGPFPGGSPAMPSAGATMPGSNPFQNPLADALTTRVNNTLQRDMLPGIRRNAIANGNFGNAKQGIAEGRAIADASTGLAGQLAQLGYQTHTADQSHQLQSDALDLNVYNANQNWARTGQQDQINNLGTFLNWNQTYGVGNTTQTQNQPLNYWQQFSNTGAQLGGMGGTNSQQYDGNPLMGAIGGWNFGSNLFKG